MHTMTLRELEDKLKWLRETQCVDDNTPVRIAADGRDWNGRKGAAVSSVECDSAYGGKSVIIGR